KRNALRKIRGHVYPLRMIIRLSGQHNVPAVREWFWETFKSFPAHEDAVAGCQVFEMAEVIGQMPEQFVVFANGVVFRRGYYQAYHHWDSGLFFGNLSSICFSFLCCISTKRWVCSRSQFLFINRSVIKTLIR